MKLRTICYIYGLAFMAVGILGFIPNFLISENGFFETNMTHNMVHILLGTVFIFGARLFPGYEQRLLKFLGIGGFVVSFIGFLSKGDKLLGIIHVNEADHWLHLALACLVFISAYAFAPTRAIAQRY